MDNREHVDNWEKTVPHTWGEHYQEYRYWSNGPVVSFFLATRAYIKECLKK